MEVLAVDALGACEAHCSELDDVTQERWKSLRFETYEIDNGNEMTA